MKLLEYDIRPGSKIMHITVANGWSNTTNHIPGKTFDAVFAFDVLDESEEPELLIAEMARMTKPGGLFRVTCSLFGVHSPRELLTLFQNHAIDTTAARVDVIEKFMVATGWR